MRHFDVIVIGAGAAGLYTASLLEKRLKVLVLEEHSQVGNKACSGLFSTHLEKFIDPSPDFVEHEVSGAKLFSPQGTVVTVQKKGTAAYVADRTHFDRHLASRLKSPLNLSERVTQLEFPDKVLVKTDKEQYTCDLVIGADGANSVVRKHFGQKPAEIVNGVIALKDGENMEKFVELHFDKSIVSDGFFWKIPRGRRTEWGVFGKNTNFRMLEQFFGLKDYKKEAAFIPIGPCKSYFERAILIGDAAGITKPWSGGGVLFALNCATIAQEVVFDAFEKGDFSESAFSAYENGWRARVGRNIEMGLLFREMYKQADNSLIERMFRSANESLLSLRDMDFPLTDIG